MPTNHRGKFVAVEISDVDATVLKTILIKLPCHNKDLLSFGLCPVPFSLLYTLYHTLFYLSIGIEKFNCKVFINRLKDLIANYTYWLTIS